MHMRILLDVEKRKHPKELEQKYMAFKHGGCQFSSVKWEKSHNFMNIGKRTHKSLVSIVRDN